VRRGQVRPGGNNGTTPPLARPPPGRQDMAAARPTGCERYPARQGHLTAADQPGVRDGVERATERPGGDEGGAPPGEAGDAVDTRGLDGLGQGHRRQDRGQPAHQHRLPRPRRAQEEEIMVRTPASALLCHQHLGKDDDLRCRPSDAQQCASEVSSEHLVGPEEEGRGKSPGPRL
jgi:hypothetical protein